MPRAARAGAGEASVVEGEAARRGALEGWAGAMGAEGAGAGSPSAVKREEMYCFFPFAPTMDLAMGTPSVGPGGAEVDAEVEAPALRRGWIIAVEGAAAEAGRAAAG